MLVESTMLSVEDLDVHYTRTLARVVNASVVVLGPELTPGSPLFVQCERIILELQVKSVLLDSLLFLPLVLEYPFALLLIFINRQELGL